MPLSRKSRYDNIVEQQIVDEIARLERELLDRRSFERPAPSSVVRAYHELIERQFCRLDLLERERS